MTLLEGLSPRTQQALLVVGVFVAVMQSCFYAPHRPPNTPKASARSPRWRHSRFSGVPTFGRCFGFLWPLRGLLLLLPMRSTLPGSRQAP